MADLLTVEEIESRLAPLHADWSGSPQRLIRSIEFADFTTAVQFLNQLAPRCEELDHHPDVALRGRWAEVALATHSAGGVTDLDFELAEIVDEVAGEVKR